MDTTSDLIARISDHCARVGIAETTFGLRTVNDGKLVARLRRGGDITTSKLQRIERALSFTPEAERLSVGG